MDRLSQAMPSISGKWSDHQIKSSLKSFFKQHLPGFANNKISDPRISPPKLVVGFSGGPDSTFLLHSLVHILGYPKECIRAVHVDHGWRKESSFEAVLVQERAQEMGVSCYIEKIEEIPQKGNLEDFSRNQRRKILIDQSRRFEASTLLLGHNEDDQLEVVSKRIFEGAPFVRFDGILPSSYEDDILILRPLLKFKKCDIEKYLSQKEIPSVTDPTNFDDSFLRARMRSHLFPALNKFFGKEVTEPLLRIGAEGSLLRDFFASYIQKAFRIIEDEKGARFLSEGGEDLYAWMQLIFLHPVLRALHLSRSQIYDLAAAAAFVKEPVHVSTKFGKAYAKKGLIYCQFLS